MAEEHTSKLTQKQYIVENGKMEKEMDMVYSNSVMHNFTKALFRDQWNMDMVLKDLAMEIFIKVNIKEEGSTAEEDIYGRMAHHMKGNLLRVWEMAKENGNHQENKAIFMLEAMRMIKNLGMVVMFGVMDVYIKAISKMTSSKYIYKFRNGKGKLIYQDGK